MLDQLRNGGTTRADAIATALEPEAALAARRTRLVGEGLLLTEAERARIRQQALWLLPLLALGIVRHVAGSVLPQPHARAAYLRSEI